MSKVGSVGENEPPSRPDHANRNQLGQVRPAEAAGAAESGGLTRASRTASLTSEGTNTGSFDSGDWALLLITAAIWGSSFLWMEIGLDHFHPGVIAWGRMVLGAAVLWITPASWAPVPRSVWPRLAVVALAGNMFPAVFFPLAQQRIESSVAGMLNSVGPIMTLLLSALMLRKLPDRNQVFGLIVGLVGAVLLAARNIAGAEAQPLGVTFAVLAVVGYSVSNNFLPPLAQQYGGAPVIARAMLASALLLTPWGVIGLGESEFNWGAFGGLLILGVFGTGLARTFFAILNGRVGAPRSALIGYLVPLVAVLLGIVVLNETVGWTELAATTLILAGATLISRAKRAPVG